MHKLLHAKLLALRHSPFLKYVQRNLKHVCYLLLEIEMVAEQIKVHQQGQNVDFANKVLDETVEAMFHPPEGASDKEVEEYYEWSNSLTPEEKEILSEQYLDYVPNYAPLDAIREKCFDAIDALEQKDKVKKGIERKIGAKR